MRKEKLQNLRLGLFIIISTSFLIIAFYLIGNKRNLFEANFKVSALFYDVSGLMRGNNVRFAGIDVGTVESVKIISDTSVMVEMVIDEDVQKYIKKNSVASIGTDGLMGNKLVNIIVVKEHATMVEDGDMLQAVRNIEPDAMLRTLNATNENVKTISSELKDVMQKINSSSSLWNLLMDTVVAENVKQAVSDIRLTGTNTAIITRDLSDITREIKGGKGTLGTLLLDTTLPGNIKETFVQIDSISNKLARVSHDLTGISHDLQAGRGAIGTILKDTTFAENLNKSMENIQAGTKNFNENMEALKHSFLLKRYFKKKEPDSF